MPSDRLNAGPVVIKGYLVGRRDPTDSGLQVELVVRVSDSPQAGPAADSIVLIAVSPDGSGRARYLSWIVGYRDLDQASELEPGRWAIVEPSLPYKASVDWVPFGWGPLEHVWTHPPLHERATSSISRNGKAVVARMFPQLSGSSW